MPKKIAIDWHGVFEVKRNGRDVIPDSHIRALWDLEGDGWRTTLLSYAGWKREQEVRAKLREIHVSFDALEKGQAGKEKLLNAWKKASPTSLMTMVTYCGSPWKKGWTSCLCRAGGMTTGGPPPGELPATTISHLQSLP